MNITSVENVRLDGICACVPAKVVDNKKYCTEKFGDLAAERIIGATGIKYRRVADANVELIDLFECAARKVILDCNLEITQIVGLVCVTFTQTERMPGIATRLHAKLGLKAEIPVLNIDAACAGYTQGLFMASLLAKQLNGSILLLDGDIQTRFVNENDSSTAPLFSDAGTASIVSPGERTFKFGFLTEGGQSDALSCDIPGFLKMDGFSVFTFVAKNVTKWLIPFMETTKISLFIAHQANEYMIKSLSKMLKISPEKSWLSCCDYGNTGSASLAVTIAVNYRYVEGRILLAAFGAGLSAGAVLMNFEPSTKCSLMEYA